MTKGHFDALLDWKNNMNINIDLDLGNVWEMLSAVGTIAAVIVSLWLARRESRIRINYHIEGFDEPMNITSGSLDNFTRIISFEFYNLGNYQISITSIRAIFLKKRANYFLKYLYPKKLRNRTKITEQIFLNDSTLGQYSILPLKVEAKSKSTFFFLYDKFIKSLPNNSNQYILFVAKDSMGNEYYDYQEVNHEKIKLYLQEKTDKNK